MYKDYLAWLEENRELLEHLEHHKSKIYERFSVILRMLNYIASMDEVNRDSELEIIFDEGFSYIYDRVNYIKAYLNETFIGDVHNFMKYDDLINYYIYVEDVKDACSRKEIDVNVFEEELDNITDEIQTIIDRRDNYDEKNFAKYDMIVSSILPSAEKIITVPEIFNQIEEEIIVEKGNRGEE